MPRLPPRFAAAVPCFAPLFLRRTRRHAEALPIGATPAPGRRTATSVLQITGLARDRRFVDHHRVLNRAAWSGRAAARVPLGLLLDASAPRWPVPPGLDGRIERRRGKRIGAKGIHRGPVRSPKTFFAGTTGPRRLSLMLLIPIPWAGQIRALPFRTVLAPSGRRRPRSRPAAQEADRLVAPAGPAGPALDAGARGGAGGRQRLRRPRTPGRPRPAGRVPRHPPAPRRGRHRTSRYLNRRTENSRRPTRRRERQMRRFESPAQAQRFLSDHGFIYGHSRPRRHLMAAADCRRARAEAFRIRRQEACAQIRA